MWTVFGSTDKSHKHHDRGIHSDIICDMIRLYCRGGIIKEIMIYSSAVIMRCDTS